ncbi:uncharacterized protein LOC126992897 [Eriocheir sinensis]|uniref:uncharacterized protein LOC126992897 n=1 Tax=Eriocheir sinensis TaxID=95602 RepID=UPI0021C654CD|nr:uncharacterized protein LOC126992897 [Eriocheir sinensis]
MVNLVVFASTLLALAAADRGYGGGAPQGPIFTHGGGGYSGGGISVGGGCGHGQVRHVDGSCVSPQVTRNLYVYRAPGLAPIVGPRPHVPPPRVEHNVIFIHSPDTLTGQKPIVVPPPKQKNVVYLLSKRPQLDQQVIEVPAPEQQAPEIFFVNYAEGENPFLPTGEDLQSALSKASQGSGELVSSGGHGGVIVDGGHSFEDLSDVYTSPALPPTIYRQP